MTASFPPVPFRAPAALPDWIERLTITLDHTPMAIDKGWRRERMWLLSNDLSNIETCLAAGFLRAQAGPATVTLDAPETGAATLTIAAPGLTPAAVVVMIRYLVTLYSPRGLPDMRPETAFSVADVTVAPATAGTEPLVDALAWPQTNGQRPLVTPTGAAVLVRDGHIPLSAEASSGAGFLEAVSAFAANDCLVPLGTATGDVDPFDFAAWPWRTPAGGTVLRVEELAIEPAALIWMVRAAAPGHRGDIAVVDEDRDT